MKFNVCLIESSLRDLLYHLQENCLAIFILVVSYRSFLVDLKKTTKVKILINISELRFLNSKFSIFDLKHIFRNFSSFNEPKNIDRSHRQTRRIIRAKSPTWNVKQISQNRKIQQLEISWRNYSRTKPTIKINLPRGCPRWNRNCENNNNGPKMSRL